MMRASWGLALALPGLLFARPLAHRCVFPGAAGRFPAESSLALRVPGARMLSPAVAWLPARGAARGTVVYFHSTNQSAGDSFWFAADLADHGVGVLLPEHRGYGGLAGVPSRDGLFADADAALALLPADAPRPLVLVGRSLGAAVAAEETARGHGAALVLLSPFRTTADVARGFGFALAEDDRFDVDASLARVPVPLTIAHGVDDGLIPIGQGEALARAHGARFLALAGAGHNDLSLRPNEEKVIAAILEAIDGAR